MTMFRALLFALIAAVLFPPPAFPQQTPVQEHVLSNGMKLLMVPRKGDPNVAAGWVAQGRFGQRATRALPACRISSNT